MPLVIDSLLHNRYRILGELGHGGMGAVYRGHDENLGVDVAVKENLFVSPEAERQFRREASLLASVRHPNLPRVTDHFVIPGQGQYLVMDFISGDDAKTLLERQAGPLAEAEVVRWGREILSALQYLHSRPQPIIHRDIKPGNIRIMMDGRAVLVDFGLAKIHDTTQTTTVGAKALTPGFAPPEQYGMGRTEPRTDIYSLAATLYTLLTNQIPVDSIDRAMGQAKLAPIRELNPAVSPRVAAAIERALAVKPEDRYATAADFSAVLAPETPAAAPTRPADALPTRVVRPSDPAVALPPVAAARPAGGGWIIPVAIIGILLLGLAGGGAWVLRGALNPPVPTPAVTLVAQPTETKAVGVAASPAPTQRATDAPPTKERATATPEASSSPTPEATAKPAATPRGGGQGQIAFVSERAGVPQVFVMNADGSDPKQLTSISDGACQPAWSPDGQQLLVVTPCDGKHPQYPRSAIYRMNADGSDLQPFITLVGGVFDAAWSESGIAFTYLENRKPRVYVAGPQGSGEKNISAAQSADSQPSWSPDGKRIAFVNTSSTGSPTIYWMYNDGTFDRTLPDPVTRDQVATSPRWSPRGGEVVAYLVKSQIFVVKWDAKGFNAFQLTDVGPNDTPAWSPDGQWLTFESWRDAANHDIYIMTSNGGQPTRLTTDPAPDYQPAWRP